MEIKEIALMLEDKINIKISIFVEVGKNSKKSADELSKIMIRADELNKEIEEYHKQMYDILLELEPVESLVKLQNPTIVPLFDALKIEYGSKDKPKTKKLVI